MAIEHTASDVTTQGLQEDHKNQLLQGSNGLSKLDFRTLELRVLSLSPNLPLDGPTTGRKPPRFGFTGRGWGELR